MSRKSKGFKSKGYTVKWEDTFSHYVIRDYQGRAVSVTQTISDAKAYIKSQPPIEGTHIGLNSIACPASVVAAQTSRENIMKTKTVFLKCPKCGAEQDWTGSDIGRLEMMPLPLHVKTLCMEKSLSGESHNSMVAAESWSDPDICPVSEQLVYVYRSSRQ